MCVRTASRQAPNPPFTRPSCRACAGDSAAEQQVCRALSVQTQQRALPGDLGRLKGTQDSPGTSAWIQGILQQPWAGKQSLFSLGDLFLPRRVRGAGLWEPLMWMKAGGCLCMRKA